MRIHSTLSASWSGSFWVVSSPASSSMRKWWTILWTRRSARKPVVDTSEVAQDSGRYPRLLVDFARGRLLGGLGSLQMPLRQAPLQAAGAIAPRYDDDVGPPLLRGYDHAAGARLVDDRERVSPDSVGGGASPPQLLPHPGRQWSRSRHISQSGCGVPVRMPGSARHGTLRGCNA